MTDCPLEPVFDRVILDRRAPSKVGSIIIPSAARMRNAPCRGRVIAKGPTADESIIVGAEYIFGVHAGGFITKDGTPAALEDENAIFFVCSDTDLIALVKE